MALPQIALRAVGGQRDVSMAMACLRLGTAFQTTLAFAAVLLIALLLGPLLLDAAG